MGWSCCFTWLSFGIIDYTSRRYILKYILEHIPNHTLQCWSTSQHWITDCSSQWSLTKQISVYAYQYIYIFIADRERSRLRSSARLTNYGRSGKIDIPKGTGNTSSSSDEDVDAGRHEASPPSTSTNDQKHNNNNRSNTSTRKPRSETWGPKCARKSKNLHTSKSKSPPSEERSSNAESLKVKSRCLQEEEDEGERACSAERAMTPNEDLESVMLSLDSTNTYTPSKQAPPPRIPYYLANIRVAMNEVLLNSPIDVSYFNVDDIGYITTFDDCEGRP